ncbi:hypothetical protein NL676_028332 [Syzygium grande]|nr:hypothetical protein NL676_028332 [Syzygium grande]
MASVKSNLSVESFPMNGGNGICSYSHNSFMQRRGIDVAMKMIDEAITENLDVEEIADLRCSVGPNTYFVVERVVESIKLKCQSQGPDLKNLEFQAFLNDQALFMVAYSGGFSSIHPFIFCAPMAIESATASDRRKIFNLEQGKDSHSKRAMRRRGGIPAAELVSGGLMAILIPSTPTCSKCTFDTLVQLMESALMDLVSSGMEALVKRNGHFSIERMDPLVCPHRAEASEVMANMTMMHFRAGWEGLIKAHFGSEMVDPMFKHFRKKVMQSSAFANPSCNQKAETFILLKRL